MTGAQITDAEAARMNLRRVIPAATPEGFWIGKQPSIRRRAGEVPLCLPPFDGHIQFGPMAGHGYHPVNEFAEILSRYEATKEPRTK